MRFSEKSNDVTNFFLHDATIMAASDYDKFGIGVLLETRDCSRSRLSGWKLVGIVVLGLFLKGRECCSDGNLH